MLKLIRGPILMPDVIDGGKNVSTSDGKLVEGSDDNNEEALAPDGDKKEEISLDDVFGEAAGNVEVKKADDSDLGIKIDKNAAVSAEEEEEVVQQDKKVAPPPKFNSDGTPVKPAGKDADRLEGETDADKELRLKRDYSSFKPEDAEYLKKLPNNIFGHVSKAVKSRYAIEAKLNETVKELTELKKNPNRVPDNWYENDKAYELTPEYQKLSQQYELAEYASDHWRRQLINIKNKQPFYGLNFQNGQMVQTGPFEATPENEVGVQQNFQQASNQMNQLSAQAEQLANQFKTRHSEISKYYEGPETTALFNKLAPELKPVDEEAEMFLNVVHPSHKSHPVSVVASKMFSVLLRQARMIKSLREAANTAKLNKQDNNAAGPSAKTKKVSVGNKTAEGEIDFEELEAEMTGQ